MINDIKNNTSKDLIKLHLGCGMCKLFGYINVDLRKTFYTDLVADCRKLPYEENTVDEIISFHLIEHFEELEGKKLIKYWKSLLKEDGRLVIECPNILGFVRRFLKTYDETKQIRPGYLYGTHSKIGRENIPNDNHKWGYTQETMKELLILLGFQNVIVGEGTDYHAKKTGPGFCLRAEATK